MRVFKRNSCLFPVGKFRVSDNNCLVLGFLSSGVARQRIVSFHMRSPFSLPSNLMLAYFQCLKMLRHEPDSSAFVVTLSLCLHGLFHFPVAFVLLPLPRLLLLAHQFQHFLLPPKSHTMCPGGHFGPRLTTDGRMRGDQTIGMMGERGRKR